MSHLAEHDAPWSDPGPGEDEERRRRVAWWLWLALGLILVGGATAAYLLLPDDGAREGDVAEQRIPGVALPGAPSDAPSFLPRVPLVPTLPDAPASEGGSGQSGQADGPRGGARGPANPQDGGTGSPGAADGTTTAPGADGGAAAPVGPGAGDDGLVEAPQPGPTATPTPRPTAGDGGPRPRPTPDPRPTPVPSTGPTPTPLFPSAPDGSGGGGGGVFDPAPMPTPSPTWWPPGVPTPPPFQRAIELVDFTPFGPDNALLYPIEQFDPARVATTTGRLHNRSGGPGTIDVSIECAQLGALDSCAGGRPEAVQFRDLMFRMCIQGQPCWEGPLATFEVREIEVPQTLGLDVSFHLWLRETGVEQAQGVTTPFTMVIRSITDDY